MGWNTCTQCSPYQALTGKIYRLQVYYNLRRRVKKYASELWSNLILTSKWMNIWKSTKVYTAFLFMGHAFWKERIEDSKIIGIKHSKLLPKENNGHFA